MVIVSVASAEKLQQFSFTLKSVEGLNKRREKRRGCYGAEYEVQLNGAPSDYTTY